MDIWAYNAAAITLFFIGLFGFTFNAIVIILMCKNIKQWTPTNIILLNLVCCDFSVSIFGNPFTLIAAISHNWIFGKTLCIMYGFFMALLGITSITTLTVLAYERYCLIKFPLTASKLNNRGPIRIIIIWSYSLALTTPPLFGWGAYVHEAANISCSVNWESKTFNATTYIVFLFIFGLVIPLIVITYSYVNIISTMKMSAVRLGRKNRAEKRINLMVAVMIFAFTLAWTPYSAFALIEQFGPSDLISPQLAVLPALIAKSSICYNPLIYVGLNPQLRKVLRKKIRKETTANETVMNHLSENDSEAIKVCTKLKVFAAKNNGKTLKSKLNQETPMNHIENDNNEETDDDENSIKEDEYDNHDKNHHIENNTISETKNLYENQLNNEIFNINKTDVIKLKNLLKNENFQCNHNNNNNNNNNKNNSNNKNINNSLSSTDDDNLIYDNNLINNEMCNKALNKNEIEMAVYLDGKSKLIKSDIQYSSNIC